VIAKSTINFWRFTTWRHSIFILYDNIPFLSSYSIGHFERVQSWTWTFFSDIQSTFCKVFLTQLFAIIFIKKTDQMAADCTEYLSNTHNHDLTIGNSNLVADIQKNFSIFLFYTYSLGFSVTLFLSFCFCRSVQRYLHALSDSFYWKCFTLLRLLSFVRPFFNNFLLTNVETWKPSKYVIDMFDTDYIFFTF